MHGPALPLVCVDRVLAQVAVHGHGAGRDDHLPRHLRCPREIAIDGIHHYRFMLLIVLEM